MYIYILHLSFIEGMLLRLIDSDQVIGFHNAQSTNDDGYIRAEFSKDTNFKSALHWVHNKAQIYMIIIIMIMIVIVILIYRVRNNNVTLTIVFL